MTRQFANFAAIDWSGAAVATPPGLAVALARAGSSPPALLTRSVAWSRGDILNWLESLAAAGSDILIGLDLSPALPFADRGSYFPGWDDAPRSANELWALVDQSSIDDPHLSAGGFLRHPIAGEHFLHQSRRGEHYEGTSGRLRECERRQAEMGLSPYSCLRLIGAAQVGKSSLTGMRVLSRLRGAVPIWPFDPVPPDGPLLVEIYTTIAALAGGRTKSRSKMYDGQSLDAALAALGSTAHAPLTKYNDHKTDALLTAAWLRANAHREELWQPAGLTPEIARTEGWTFGVT